LNKVNFIRKKGNYKHVQSNLIAEISKHIPEGYYSETVGKNVRREDTINLSLFIHQYSDVLMSHGAADKNYLFMRDDETGKRLLNDFLHVLVPGDWLKERLLKAKTITLTEEQIHVVGWPRIEYLLNLREESISEGDGICSKRRVLWAPTHNYRKRGGEQKSTSSYPDFKRFTSVMKQKYDYEISLHPRNRFLKRPTGEQLVRADVVISDFGTLVYEAWALGIPVVFPRWILGNRIIKYNKGSAEAYIFENNIGLYADSIEELLEMTDTAVGIGSEVQEFMSRYLPKRLDTCSGEVIAELLGKLRSNEHRSDYATLR